MRHWFPLFVTLSVLTALPGCGAHGALTAPLRPSAAAQARGTTYSGCYLSLDLAPSTALAAQATQLRRQLGFLDMGRAQPPRDPNKLHVTVGYFQKLPQAGAGALAEHFRGKHATVTVEGYGVANKQAAYFTVKGMEDERQILQGLKLAYEADDAHITFGVCPGNPKDVHHVPKLTQQSLAAITLEGEFHLVQGGRAIW